MPAREVMIVRRGVSDWYYEFLQTIAAQRRIQIMVDRRVAERRQRRQRVDADRRSGDRRTAPPETWDAADFMIVTMSGYG